MLTNLSQKQFSVECGGEEHRAEEEEDAVMMMMNWEGTGTYCISRALA
jgi:hypothetical protein